MNLPLTEAPANLPKRARIFQQCYAAFWADVGDIVYFKNVAVKKRVRWKVIGIETDYKKVKNWTKKTNRPNFIHLQREDQPHVTVWTCSDQLSNAGFTK